MGLQKDLERDFNGAVRVIVERLEEPSTRKTAAAKINLIKSLPQMIVQSGRTVDRAFRRASLETAVGNESNTDVKTEFAHMMLRLSENGGDYYMLLPAMTLALTAGEDAQNSVCRAACVLATKGVQNPELREFLTSAETTVTSEKARQSVIDGLGMMDAFRDMKTAPALRK